VAQLLSEYKDVFSCGDHDMGLAKAVCHEIPLVAGTVPIRQPTRRLGPEKEKEVSRQVQDLLNRDLIEPAHGAWTSPVVLVRKKDDSWRAVTAAQVAVVADGVIHSSSKDALCQ